MRDAAPLVNFLKSAGSVLLGLASLAVAGLIADDLVGRELDEGLRSLAIMAGLLGFVLLVRNAIRRWKPDLDDLWREGDASDQGSQEASHAGSSLPFPDAGSSPGRDRLHPMVRPGLKRDVP